MKKLFSFLTVLLMAVSMWGANAPANTILWADDFGSAQGDAQTTFTKITTMISDYEYAGRSGYEDNANDVSLTGDNNVRISKASGTNVTDTHLWFVKQGQGVLTTSAINLYGAKKVNFSLDRSKGLTTVSYSFNGSTWNSLWTETSTGAVTNKNADIETDGQSSIYIKIVEGNNSNNLRVDNLSLKVVTAGEGSGSTKTLI